jgi:PAS domain S-box-containing protein
MYLFLLLFSQLLIIASVILILYKLKPKISLAPLFVFLGSIQYAQHILASTLHFNLWGDLTFSSGSSIFFASSLFAILLIYIKEGIPQTRTLIVGILFSNVALTMLGSITSLAVSSFRNSMDASVPVEFFDMNYWTFLVGTVTLALDAFLLVIIYQFFVSKAKLLKMFGGILISLITTLYFDSLLFSLGGFYGTPEFRNFLISQLFGKTITGLLFGVILFSYLRFIDEYQPEKKKGFFNESDDVFSILTYRGKFGASESDPATDFETQLTKQLVDTLEKMSDGFVSYDKNWRFAYVNEVASALLGKKPSDLIGKHVWTDFSATMSDQYYKNCHTAAAMGKQIELEHYNEAYNKWFQSRLIPSKNGLSVFFKDVTEAKEAAIAIERSNQRNAALLKAMPDLMFDIDEDGVFIDFHNPHGRETLVPLDNYVGANIAEILPPDLAAETLSNIERTIKTGEIAVHLYDLQIGGQTRYFEARYVKNTETDVISVVRDITEEEVTRTLLKESESKYRSLVEQASDGIIVHDMSGNLLEINHAALRYCGYRRSEVEGFILSDFLFLEDLKDLPIPFEKLKNGETTATRRRIRRKDGSSFWMDISSRMNDEGNVIAIARDVTDRLKIEKEVVESENRFRTLTENAPIGIFQTDLLGSCVYVNDQYLRMAGLTYDKAMGDGWVNGIYPDDRERLKVEWMESLNSENGFFSEFKMQGSNGNVVDSEVRAIGLFDDSGEQFGFIGTVNDVTRQKKADAELKVYREQLEHLVEERTAELEIEKVKAQSADNLKSAFLATMSHELRTPLNSIIGFTGLLINELAGPVNDEQKKQLGMVKNSGRHLLSLINDILDLSKIEAGELSFTKNAYDFGASVEKIVGLVFPQADSKGLELKYEIPSKDFQFVNDQRRVEQVLINLLDNAIKFTNQGEVSLICEVDDKILKIVVKDTGIGIRKEDVEKLFVPFSQIDYGLTRNHQGTGLGLSISKKLVKMLGGTIRVESEFGRGSRFILGFPVNGGCRN